MQKIPLFPLRIRLLLLLLISLIPGIVLTIYTLQDERQRANVEAQDLACRLANIISVHQREMILGARQFLFTASQYPKIGGGDHSHFLANLLAHLPIYSEIGVADTEGTIIASAVPTSKHINIADRTYFRAALETGDIVVGEYQTSQTTGKPSINFAYPIEDESGKTVGVLFAELNLEKLRDLESLVGRQLPEGWTLRMIDKNGILVAQYPNGHSNTGHQASDLSGIVKDITQGEGTVWGTDSVGKARLYAHSEIRTMFFPSGISVVLDIPGECAISAVNHMFSRSLVVLSLFGLVVLLVGGVANEFYLVRGLSAVRNAALQLTGGDLRARVGHVRGLKEVRDLGSAFNGMSAVIESREIEREQAAESLRESEERYRSLFTFSPDAIYVHIEERVTLVNPAMCKLLGASEPSQLIGKSVFEIVHPEYHKIMRERWKVIFGGQPASFLEEKFIRLDGTVVDVEVSAVAIDWQGSKRVQVIVRDITERKKVEETLRQNEAVLRSMLHATPAGVALLVNRKITKVNRALCLLFGYSEEEFLNQDTHMLYPNREDFKRVEEELNYNIMHQGLGTIETQLRRKDGVLIDVLLNLSPFNPSSLDEGLTATVLDITDRKRAEETVKTSLEQMRLLASKIESTREEERKSISREVHDELGQVLTGIRMELEEIERIEPVKNDSFLLKINSIYNLLDEAITTVQDISARLRPGILDDLGLFAAVEWQTDEFQKRSGITCTLELPEMDSSLDENRSTALFRIFQETLTNVARHAHAKNVNIKLLETNDAFTLTVRDNGIGITENHLKDPRSLGLIGIQERLRPFHGTCTIQTMQDGGTEVQVYLPKEILI